MPDDPPTFDEVYAVHFGDLTVQLYAYFGDRQEAQDVVQEAFCRAYSRWKTVSRYDDPVAWIRGNLVSSERVGTRGPIPGRAQDPGWRRAAPRGECKALGKPSPHLLA